MILGFKLDQTTPLTSILLSGGMLSMVEVSVVVVISTAFVGIFAGTFAFEQSNHGRYGILGWISIHM